jgi:hypothetical protein
VWYLCVISSLFPILCLNSNTRIYNESDASPSSSFFSKLMFRNINEWHALVVVLIWLLVWCVIWIVTKTFQPYIMKWDFLNSSIYSKVFPTFYLILHIIHIEFFIFIFRLKSQDETPTRNIENKKIKNPWNQLNIFITELLLNSTKFRKERKYLWNS